MQSLSFEFCSVTLGRSWVNPAVFAARFWHFPDPARLLCDGNLPAQGDWPAYVTGLVLARNIVATAQSTAGPVAQPVASFPPVQLKGPIQHLPIIERFPIISRPISGLRPEPMLRAVDLGTSSVGTLSPASPAAQVMMRPMMMAHLDAFSFPALPQTQTPTEPAAPTTTAPPTTAATPNATTTPGSGPPNGIVPNASVSILAFICKSLPKSPNPDPTLNWTNAPASVSSAASAAPS